MSRRAFLRVGAAAPAAFLSALAACDVRDFAHRHGAKRRLSIGTAGTGATIYIYGGAIAKVISTYLPRVEATAELTAGAVDNLRLLVRGAVDLAGVMSDALDDALQRRGSFAGGPAAPARTLVNLYRNPMHLATFADRHGAHVKNGIRIHLFLSREEMADMIGTASETAMRLLKDFREEKVLEVNGRDILVLDRDRLLRTAGLEESWRMAC